MHAAGWVQDHGRFTHDYKKMKHTASYLTVGMLGNSVGAG